MANGVTLRRSKTSGPKYGCDHCHARYKKPTDILSLYIYEEWSQDIRAAINFCIPCSASLGNALIQLGELTKAQ